MSDLEQWELWFSTDAYHIGLCKVADSLLRILQLTVVPVSRIGIDVERNRDLFAHTEDRAAEGFGNHEAVPSTKSPVVFEGNMKAHEGNAGLFCQQYRTGLGNKNRSTGPVGGGGDCALLFEKPPTPEESLHASTTAGATHRFISEVRNDSGNVLAVKTFARDHADSLLSKSVCRRKDGSVPEAENHGMGIERSRAALLDKD